MLLGSVANAYNKKLPACTEIMRAEGMWAPTVQLHRSCLVAMWIPGFGNPDSSSGLQVGLEVHVPGALQFPVVKLTHSGARLWLLSPLPRSSFCHKRGLAPAR